MVVLLVVALASCGRDAGTSTDPSRAADCDELADIAINQLEAFLEDAVGDLSSEEFTAAYESDGGEAFSAVSESYSEASQALDIRRGELSCTDDEFQELLCARLDEFVAAGSAAEQVLGPSRSACG